MNVLLERGIIPIINENDTVTAERLTFGDNDTLSAKVAGLVDADQLVILSDIDGLYTANPKKYSHAKLLENVDEITPKIEEVAEGTGRCCRYRGNEIENRSCQNCHGLWNYNIFRKC